jgi:hypothetical protein
MYLFVHSCIHGREKLALDDYWKGLVVGIKSVDVISLKDEIDQVPVVEYFFQLGWMRVTRHFM